jgi:E3 ubiquitin-protein ligase RNFT1
VSIRIVALDEVATSSKRADEVIFEEEEDDGHATCPKEPSPVAGGRESSSLY